MRTRTRPVISLVALVATVVLAGALAPASARTPSAPQVELRIMSFNILYGGDELALNSAHHHWCNRPAGCRESLEQVVAAIRAADADVVGLQEATGNTCWIAERLGWYCDVRMQLISRFPLVDPPGADGVYVFAVVAPGRVVALANVHLPSDPYGPYFPRDGWTLDQVLELERSVRLPGIQPQLAALPALAAEGIPVFFTGDFNSPSHLDWTEAMVTARPDVVIYPIDWPVAKALADAGFRDSYREVYPDPVARMGFTWTPGYPQELRDEVDDRIDRVLASGPSTTLDSRIVGESAYADVDIPLDPWPSDHRGIVSTFWVTPGEPPVFAASDSRRVFTGGDLDVRFHASGTRGERVAILPAGTGVSAAVASQGTAGARDGVLRFPTGSWDPGTYEAVVVSGGAISSGRARFYAYAPGTPVSVWTSQRVYERGDPIEVSWRAAPGMRWDWLGLYKPGDGPVVQAEDCYGGYCSNGNYRLYEYTHSEIEGTIRFTATSPVGSGSWPLKPGNYQIGYLLDDGYAVRAWSPTFKVVRPG